MFMLCSYLAILVLEAKILPHLLISVGKFGRWSNVGFEDKDGAEEAI
jgi:hypothetical protein